MTLPPSLKFIPFPRNPSCCVKMVPFIDLVVQARGQCLHTCTRQRTHKRGCQILLVDLFNFVVVCNNAKNQNQFTSRTASHTSSVVQSCLIKQPFTHEIKLNPKSAAPHSAWQCCNGDADAKCSVAPTCPGSSSHRISAPRFTHHRPRAPAPHPQRSTAHASAPLSTAKATE